MPATNRHAACPFLIGRRFSKRETSSNQKGAISVTVCGWHVWILLRITAAWIHWDFDFLRGLAPGRLDGFSIGRYGKNRESFDLYAAKFESGAMRFWWEKSPRRWNPSKQGFHPCPSLIKTVNRELKFIQNRSKNRFWGKRTSIHHR